MRFIFLFIFLSINTYAQKYLSNEGFVYFFSEAPLENIESENHQLSGVVDLKTGQFAFRLFMQDFHFDNKLMEEHFNESYLESELYPFSTFTGNIEGLKDLDLSTIKQVEVFGDMLIHGVRKKIKIDANIYIIEDKFKLEAKFSIKLADYKIEIPKILFYNIAEVVDVSVQMNLSKLE